MPALTQQQAVETEPDIRPEVRLALTTALHDWAEIKAARDHADAQLAASKGRIDDLMAGIPDGSVSIAGFKVTLVTPTVATLDKERLLVEGVTLAQIERATIVRPGRPYHKITVPGRR